MQRLLLVLLVCSSYALFAGRPEWTAIPLLLLAAGAVLASPRRTLAFPSSYRRLDWALAVIIAGLLLQLLPLPRAVVAVISPQSIAVRDRLTFAHLGATPAWASLSIDADSTLVALGTFVLAVLTFWAARALFSRKGTRRFCQALAIIGGVASVVAIAQRTVAPDLVLGMLRPDTPSASPFGAFINRNHFGGWVIMIAGPVAGYLVAHVKSHPQYGRGPVVAVREMLRTGSLLSAIAGLFSVGALFLTLSRSAVVGLAAACVSGWWLGRSRLNLSRQRSAAMVAAGGAVVLALAFFFVDAGRWAARIGSSFERSVSGTGGRLAIWSETMPMVRDFPITGIGAGTYADAMTVYQQTRIWVGSMSEWTHFNTAHSHYVQLLAEGGVLLTLPFVVGLWALLAIGRRALANDRSQNFWVRVGAAAGLIGIAVQSVWEVPLVMPANAVLAAVLAALVVHERSNEPGGARDTSENH